MRLTANRATLTHGLASALLIPALMGILAVANGCRGSGTDARELTIALAVFPAEAAHYHEFVRDFEARQHVHIEFVAQSYSDILRALHAEAGAGRGRLDLVELDLSMLGEARSSVRRLDRIVNVPARALFPQAAWDVASAGHHVYFVPHRLMWQAMIYNRREVPHPPSTWAELRDFARRNPGKLGLKAARYEGLICDVMPFVWSAGGDELGPESGASLRAIDFLGALGPELNPESAVFREMSILETQARGEVWIHFNWPFAMGYLNGKGLAPAVELSAPLPAGPDGMATPLGGGYLAIPRSAPHAELASAFIRYLMNPDVQQKLSRQMGWYGSIPPPPGTVDAQLYAGFTAMRPYVRARPAICNYVELSNRWQRAVRAVLFSDQSPRAMLQTVALGFDGQRAQTVASGCD
jgi:ABC-type glycerol-3-phosphate transport system substrate-binding protein